MSESDRRKAISVYLTPRASMILRDYNKGSGYGSISRTVEEIILAFDNTYKVLKETVRLLNDYAKSRNKLTPEDFRTLYLLMYSQVRSLDNTISRLTPSSTV
jgi:hypothetical protein